MDSRYGSNYPSNPQPLPAAQDGPSRRRVALQPPAITTEFSDPQQLGQQHSYGFIPTPSTPRTALSAPFSPWEGSNTSSGSSPASRLAPQMAVRRGHSPMVPYNPQEWQRDGAVVGRGYTPYAHASRGSTAGHSLRDASGNEGMVLHHLFSLNSPENDPIFQRI